MDGSEKICDALKRVASGGFRLEGPPPTDEEWALLFAHYDRVHEKVVNVMSERVQEDPKYADGCILWAYSE